MTRCNRCDWTPDQSDSLTHREQSQEHATEAGHWLCDCGASLTEQEPRTCERCLTDARSLLAGLLLMFEELPHHLRTVSGSALAGARGGSDGPPLPGGQVLALLGPGRPGGEARRLTSAEQQRLVTRPIRWWVEGRYGPLTAYQWSVEQNRAEGREHALDNMSTDTPSVAWALASWEQDWRETRNDPPPRDGLSVPAVVRAAGRYLEIHARWAANNHEAFPEFLADLRDLHVKLEAATHRLRRPAKANAACFACGGDLIRRVVDGLEEDAVTCRDCREQYDPARYGLALKAAAEAASTFTEDGEQWATPAVLATELERSEHTIRSWAQRDQIRHHTRAGVLFVNAEQARARDAETPRRRTA